MKKKSAKKRPNKFLYKKIYKVNSKKFHWKFGRLNFFNIFVVSSIIQRVQKLRSLKALFSRKYLQLYKTKLNMPNKRQLYSYNVNPKRLMSLFINHFYRKLIPTKFSFFYGKKRRKKLIKKKMQYECI